MEFTNSFDFTQQTIDQSLRNFLDSFTLPGEAQQVDRILQAFSQKFHKDNPELFKTSESVYLLSSSLMILQTDLHNPQVKEKMKLGDFFKMTKGINDGGDFSSDYLRTMYNSINEQPLAIHQLDKRRENEKKELLFLEETKSLLKQGQQQLFRLKTATNPRNFNIKIF